MGVSIGIRGAGVAGLSLAHALQQRLPDAQLSLFDVRPREPHPQRTFCFFDDRSVSVPVPSAQAWRRVRFAGHGFSRSIACDNSPYTLIRGDTFYREMLANLEGRGVSFSWECQEVTAKGSQIAADAWQEDFDLVIDATFDRAAQQPLLWQSFAGVWVEAEGDAFDAHEALLMDLGPSSAESPISFIYMLPTSARTALVEHTTFSRRPLPQEWHLEQCRKWQSLHGLPPWRVEGLDSGAIPMGRVSRGNNGRDGMLRIGSGGGALRASTGYAFHAIQRQVSLLADAIQDGVGRGSLRWVTQPSAFPLWMRIADEAFLRALARVPERGSVLLERLLRHAPERELVAFLAGRSSFAEAFKVMNTLPKGAMLQALCFG